MFGLNESMSYHLYAGYLPMGGGIEKLSELARTAPNAHLLSGDVFLFFGKDRAQIKILRWNIDGYMLYQKRLEEGTFELPRFKPGERWITLDWKIFVMIMTGIPLRSGKFRKRFVLQPNALSINEID